MNKPKINTSIEEAADALDLSYMELQEKDFLDSQNQEIAWAVREE